MKHTDKLKLDYKKHGYKIAEESDGFIVFDTDREYNKKHIDKSISKTHPIFTDEHGEQIGDKSTCVIHSLCGHCNCYLKDNKCPECGRVYGIRTMKAHIPYPDEIKKGV